MRMSEKKIYEAEETVCTQPGGKGMLILSEEWATVSRA